MIYLSSLQKSSVIVVVGKRDGTTRFCVYYRHLNAYTIKDTYPFPRIDDSLVQLSGNKWISTLDLYSGYWQIKIKQSDRPQTVFAPHIVSISLAVCHLVLQTSLWIWQCYGRAPMGHLSHISGRHHHYSSNFWWNETYLHKVLVNSKGAGLQLKLKHLYLFA